MKRILLIVLLIITTYHGYGQSFSDDCPVHILSPQISVANTQMSAAMDTCVLLINNYLPKVNANYILIDVRPYHNSCGSNHMSYELQVNVRQESLVTLNKSLFCTAQYNDSCEFPYHCYYKGYLFLFWFWNKELISTQQKNTLCFRNPSKKDIAYQDSLSNGNLHQYIAVFMNSNNDNAYDINSSVVHWPLGLRDY